MAKIVCTLKATVMMVQLPKKKKIRNRIKCEYDFHIYRFRRVILYNFALLLPLSSACIRITCSFHLYSLRMDEWTVHLQMYLNLCALFTCLIKNVLIEQISIALRWIHLIECTWKLIKLVCIKSNTRCIRFTVFAIISIIKQSLKCSKFEMDFTCCRCV